MFNLDKFISESVTFRPESMFKADIEANAVALTREIKAQVVEAIKDFIPNFEHEEKGKNLDQKM